MNALNTVNWGTCSPKSPQKSFGERELWGTVPQNHLGNMSPYFNASIIAWNYYFSYNFNASNEKALSSCFEAKEKSSSSSILWKDISFCQENLFCTSWDPSFWKHTSFPCSKTRLDHLTSSKFPSFSNFNSTCWHLSIKNEAHWHKIMSLDIVFRKKDSRKGSQSLALNTGTDIAKEK